MSRARWTWRVIGAIAAAGAGAVLGASIQEMFDSALTVAALLSAVLSLALIAALAALAVLDKRMDDDTQAFASLLSRLEEQVGVQVDVQLVDDLNKRGSMERDRVVEEIERAKEEVLVMDLILDDGGVSDLHRVSASIREDIMNESLARLLALSERGVTYKRICQTPDLNEPFGRIRDRGFLLHCARMCEIREENRRARSRPVLKTAVERYPYKFIIIDRRVLVLQIHRLRPTRDGELAELLWCELIIADPANVLVPVFMDMWNELFDDEESAHLVRRAEIPVELSPDPAAA